MSAHLADGDREMMLQRYVDGLMTHDERANFSRVLAADPELAAEAELMIAIDRRLRELVIPEAVPLPREVDLRAAGGAAEAPAPHRRPTFDASSKPSPADTAGARTSTPDPIVGRITPAPVRRWLSIAALVAITAIGAWLGISQWISRGPDVLIVTAPEVYETQLARGFVPEWVCDDDAEFARSVKDRLGQALLVSVAAITGKPDVEVVGWAYPATGYEGKEIVLSKDTMILLARVQREPVVVLVDRLRNDRPDLVSQSREGARVFRSEVGDLVLYEVTPRAEPGVLARAYQPDR